MNSEFLSAATAHVDNNTRTVDITLEDGQIYRCSLEVISERLRLVDPSLLLEWEWIGPRAGMHWPTVDEDLSIEYLIANGVRLDEQDSTVETTSALRDYQPVT